MNRACAILIIWLTLMSNLLNLTTAHPTKRDQWETSCSTPTYTGSPIGDMTNCACLPEGSADPMSFNGDDSQIVYNRSLGEDKCIVPDGGSKFSKAECMDWVASAKGTCQKGGYGFGNCLKITVDLVPAWGNVDLFNTLQSANEMNGVPPWN